jgi:hypothetical protein
MFMEYGTWRSGEVKRTAIDKHGKPIAFVRDDDPTARKNLFMMNGGGFARGQKIIYMVTQGSPSDVAYDVMPEAGNEHLLSRRSRDGTDLPDTDKMLRELGEYCDGLPDCSACEPRIWAVCGARYPIDINLRGHDVTIGLAYRAVTNPRLKAGACR